MLFLYLPIKISYQLVEKNNYFYFSYSLSPRGVALAKSNNINWDMNKLYDLYKGKTELLQGISIGYTTKSFFFKNFILNDRGDVHSFDNFFIDIPDIVKIQLIEFRNLYFGKKNIFDLISKNLKKSSKIDGRVYIPLDKKRQTFLECIEIPNNKYKVNGIIRK